MTRGIKLGCVSFLNGRPLVYPLAAGLLPHPFEIEYDEPSSLVAGLKDGRFDIAMASSGSLLGFGDEYSYIPGIGICSDGPVKSVLMCHSGEIGELKRVYPDPASVTSNLLVRIILKKKYNLEPEFAPLGGVLPEPEKLGPGEGCVVIGDRALRAKIDIDRKLDLGAAWKDLTGLPFVYALWIGRREFITDAARIPLHNAYLMGTSMLRQIVESIPELPLDTDAAVRYLERNVVYEVTELAELGLDLFLELAGEYA